MKNCFIFEDTLELPPDVVNKEDFYYWLQSQKEAKPAYICVSKDYYDKIILATKDNLYVGLGMAGVEIFLDNYLETSTMVTLDSNKNIIDIIRGE